MNQRATPTLAYLLAELKVLYDAMDSDSESDSRTPSGISTCAFPLQDTTECERDGSPKEVTPDQASPDDTLADVSSIEDEVPENVKHHASRNYDDVIPSGIAMRIFNGEVPTAVPSTITVNDGKDKLDKKIGKPSPKPSKIPVPSRGFKALIKKSIGVFVTSSIFQRIENGSKNKPRKSKIPVPTASLYLKTEQNGASMVPEPVGFKEKVCTELNWVLVQEPCAFDDEFPSGSTAKPSATTSADIGKRSQKSKIPVPTADFRAKLAGGAFKDLNNNARSQHEANSNKPSEIPVLKNKSGMTKKEKSKSVNPRKQSLNKSRIPVPTSGFYAEIKARARKGINISTQSSVEFLCKACSKKPSKIPVLKKTRDQKTAVYEDVKKISDQKTAVSQDVKTRDQKPAVCQDVEETKDQKTVVCQNVKKISDQKSAVCQDEVKASVPSETDGGKIEILPTKKRVRFAIGEPVVCREEFCPQLNWIPVQKPSGCKVVKSYDDVIPPSILKKRNQTGSKAPLPMEAQLSAVMKATEHRNTVVDIARKQEPVPAKLSFDRNIGQELTWNHWYGEGKLADEKKIISSFIPENRSAIEKVTGWDGRSRVATDKPCFTYVANIPDHPNYETMWFNPLDEIMSVRNCRVTI